MVNCRCSLMFPSSSQTATRETGSSPVVGSSRKKIFGWCTNPRAISSLRRMPPESVLVAASRHPAGQLFGRPLPPLRQVYQLQELFNRFLALLRRNVVKLGVNVHVLLDG